MNKIQLLTFIISFLILSCENNYYVKIGDKTFPFELKDTSAANELKSKLPFKVKMTKLNNNEIYYRFDGKFTTNSKSVGTINEGDIYLYEDNCLVLFYKTFTTSYSYSELGRLTDSKGLAEAIGDGSSIEVEWGLNSNGEAESTNTTEQKDSTFPINSNTDSTEQKESTIDSTVPISTDMETDSNENFTEFTKNNNHNDCLKFNYFINIFLIFINI